MLLLRLPLPLPLPNAHWHCTLTLATAGVWFSGVGLIHVLDHDCMIKSCDVHLTCACSSSIRFCASHVLDCDSDWSDSALRHGTARTVRYGMNHHIRVITYLGHFAFAFAFSIVKVWSGLVWSSFVPVCRRNDSMLGYHSRGTWEDPKWIWRITHSTCMPC